MVMVCSLWKLKMENILQFDNYITVFLNSKNHVKTNEKLHFFDNINLKHLDLSLSFQKEEQGFGKAVPVPADHHYLVILLTKHL